LAIIPMELVPEPGELWEIVLPGNGKQEKIKQLRLVKRSEMTYTFADPDCSIYFPKPIHLQIPKCKLVRKIPECPMTKINGIPDSFYEDKTDNLKKPRPVFNWSIDKQKYINGEIKPN